MKKLSEKEFWDEEWKKEKREYSDEFIFSELFARFLPRGGSYLEIGCAPGTIMTYFNRNFQYQVSGVDYSSMDIVKDNLNKYNVANYQIYNEDFTSLRLNKKFNVVASFGFVEHFTNYEEIISKHAELVDKNGHLIIEIPNIRYFNYLLYRIFNPELLKIHNLKVMNLKELSKSIRNHHDFEIIFCNYYKSCFLFFNENNAELSSRPFLKKVFSKLKLIGEKLRLDNIPNRFFSPYIVLIAKRK